MAIRAKHITLLSILWLHVTLLPAQQGAYSFLHYTSEHGLSNDRVADVLKDRQGFLWVATLHGLNRFDGLNFRQFFHEQGNPNSLRSNNVQKLTLAPDGAIWISSPGGICRLDPATLHFEPIFLPENADTIDNDQVGRVVFDENGLAWVSAFSGIYCLDPVTRRQVGFWETPQHIGNFSTYLDRSGQLWLSNDNRFHRFDTRLKKLRQYKELSPGLPMEKVSVMRVNEDHEGKIWIGTWFKGMVVYDAGRDSLIDHPDPASLTTSILPDTTYDGRPFFWAGGGDHGLYLYFPKENRVREFPPDAQDPFAHNNYLVSSFFKDHKTGEVWIGTEVGLELYAPASIRFGRVTIPAEDRNDQFNLVSSVVKDQTDPSGQTYFISLWINGVFKWDRSVNSLRKLSRKELPLWNDGIFSMMQDRQGYIWLGTWLGVLRFQPKTGEIRIWKNLFKGKNGRSHSILCMLEDTRGRLWFGSNGEGLFRYNPLTGQIVNEGLPDSAFFQTGRQYISALTSDSAGRLWISTNLAPVRYDPSTRALKIFHQKENIANPAWAGIHVSRSGLVYAVVEGALLEMDSDGNLLRQFVLEKGSLSGQPAFLVEDRKGNIWLNSDHFLHCLDLSTGKFSYYGIADGLFSNAPTDALCSMPDGEIFIGFQNAFNYFHPSMLRKNTTPPPVAITSIRVMNKERSLEIERHRFVSGIKKERSILILRPGETLFTIEFAALNFNQPGRNRYAYKLEGFDEDWNYSERPVATYTNLDGGDYMLRLKAANNDGVWNEAGAWLLIRVVPPLVKRWYFRLFLLLFAGGLLLGIWYYRRLQRKRLDAFRERLARDLHDEMGSTLSSIRFFSEFARQQTGQEKPQVASLLQRISESASALSENMQDIVWAMKTKGDRLDDLTARMTEFGLNILEARNVHFKTFIDAGISGRQLTPEQRRNVYLIFKEAVNNAAKYSDASEVELSIVLKKGLFSMKISDNGKGFDPVNLKVTGGGNGFNNMLKRAAEIGGNLEIVSSLGTGTMVKLKVKV